MITDDDLMKLDMSQVYNMIVMQGILIYWLDNYSGCLGNRLVNNSTTLWNLSILQKYALYTFLV